MNQDFHYNATYLAAALAGYSHEESLVIAHAAQFVDDCTPEVMPSNPFISQVATCEDSSTLAKHIAGAAPYKEHDIAARRRVWSYFHFLPGNLGNTLSYNGPLQASSVEGVNWSFEPTGAEAFQLICQPNSDLSLSMIQRLIDNVPNTENPLELIGLTMHVLADTWAHSYFSGTPHQCTNDVIINHSDFLFEYRENEKLILTPVQSLGDIICNDKPDLSLYGAVIVDSPRFVSPVYLGHGRVGHLPDYAYCKYSYIPYWKSSLQGDARYLVKDNPATFLSAFKQLVAVMKAIRNHENYHIEDDNKVLTPDFITDLQQILSVRTIDLSDQWNTLIKKYKDQVLPTYDKAAWIKDFSSKQNSNDPTACNSHYIAFTKAARSHYDWIDPIVSSHFIVSNVPFSLTSNGKNYILNGGTLTVDSSLMVQQNNSVSNYTSEQLPGIQKIDVLRSSNYATNDIVDNQKRAFYEYVLVIHAGCPSSISSLLLHFKDRAGDVYSLTISDSDVKDHTVFFNSTNPEIIQIDLLVNNSFTDTIQAQAGQVYDTVKQAAGRFISKIFG